MSALDFQVGGDHYKDCAYQPVQFINDLDLNFIQGNITKYLTRYKRKDGKKDLEKILHYGCLGWELNPRYYGNGDRDKTLYYAKCNNISPIGLDILFATIKQDYEKVVQLAKSLIDETTL